MPGIVVLDAYTANPGDLSWDALHALGDVHIHERTSTDQVLERAKGAEIILTNKTVLDREAINALPDLRYIGVLATGYNVIDIDAARERGIVVSNIPAYSTASVAQHVFALLLEMTNQVARHDQAVHSGDWVACEDFSFTRAPLVELAGQTLAIIGLGAIGQATAAVGQAFGMKVIGTSRTPKDLPGVEWVSLEAAIERADVLSLHCPLTEATKHLINADTLAQMKPTAFLINTGRGPLIDESALAAALNKGRIAGAALDVLSTEPPAPDNPLLTAPRCFLTPHIAWATQAARARLIATAAANVEAFLNGSPRNVVV